MYIKFCAGWIRRASMDEHKELTTWAHAWRQRAEIAELRGNELVVFEVPRTQSITIIEDIEQDLQAHYSIPLDVDIAFIKSLLE
jgi:4-hydroxy-3-methylbut-2-en-1-yl diphosphate synthase IspG/GcpE